MLEEEFKLCGVTISLLDDCCGWRNWPQVKVTKQTGAPPLPMRLPFGRLVSVWTGPLPFFFSSSSSCCCWCRSGDFIFCFLKIIFRCWRFSLPAAFEGKRKDQKPWWKERNVHDGWTYIGPIVYCRNLLYIMYVYLYLCFFRAISTGSQNAGLEKKKKWGKDKPSLPFHSHLFYDRLNKFSWLFAPTSICFLLPPPFWEKKKGRNVAALYEVSERVPKSLRTRLGV